ncbi:MAG TPA: protein TolR [Steroidobacteraceae bacterium]|jgi:biopolymer transport protein TolR
MAQVSRGRRLMGEINVVPYIDVMLVLLIIFMITAPLLNQGVRVNLPKAHAQPLPTKSAKDPVILTVNGGGQLFLNIASDPNSPVDSDTVVTQVSGALQNDPDRAILVKADKSVTYGTVMQAMVILQRAGADKVGMVADPLPPSPRAGS